MKQMTKEKFVDSRLYSGKMKWLHFIFAVFLASVVFYLYALIVTKVYELNDAMMTVGMIIFLISAVLSFMLSLKIGEFIFSKYWESLKNKKR